MVQLQARFPIAAPVRMEQPASTDLSWLEVDLCRVEANARAIRSVLGPGCRLCPVLKKNAYGLGAVPIAHRLAKAGADMFAVYSPDEAEQLVASAVTTPILILMPLRTLGRTDGLYRHAVAEKLHLSIHDPAQLDEINAVGQQLGIKLPCHLHVDTGMSRSGLSPAQALGLIRSTTAHRYVRLAGVYTHLATSGSDPAFAGEQVARYDALLDEAGPLLSDDVIRHAANTTALLRDANWHRGMARPGIGIYGYGPDTADTQHAGWIEDAPPLLPALRWCSKVIHVQQHAEGTPVSYDSTHTLQRDSVLGVVPVGHGDGYPAALSNNATVRVLGTDCRVLGQVSMDQIVIDLTDVPANDAPQDPASLMGAEAEVYSNDPDAPHALPKLAELAGTRVYEMLCRLSPRLSRRYGRG